MKHYLSSNEVADMVYSLAAKIEAAFPSNLVLRIYGVPRGGDVVASMLSMIQNPIFKRVEKPEDSDVIVDDLIDSGETEKRHAQFRRPFMALLDKREEEWSGKWVVFPWETDEQAPAENNVTRILQAVGEDPTREGLVETPARYIKFLSEFTSPDEVKMTVFRPEGYDEMIVQSDIPFYSICEHHMVPFFGTAVVGYIPNGKIVGLSKLARVVDYYARRLQNQERITHQVAERIQEALNPLGVAVLIRARHLCMEMRGIKKPGAVTTTTCVKGLMKDDPKARAEFLQYANKA